jgi:hypothetical protein
MKPFYIIYSSLFHEVIGTGVYDTIEEAIKELKGLKEASKRNYYIMESKVYSGNPPPQIDLDKVS